MIPDISNGSRSNLRDEVATNWLAWGKPQSERDIQLALELSNFDPVKATSIMALPLFRIAAGDESGVTRFFR